MRWLWAGIAVTMTMNVFAAVDYKVVTQQSVTDTREIEIMREELFLGSETIERILITDILNDGFDQNDAAVLYPTGRVLRLEPMSERLDSLLRSFKLPPNTEIYEGIRFHSAYDSVSVQSRGGRALGYGLLGGLQQRLELGYRGRQVEGYFKVSESGAQIRVWNFDSTRVSFPMPEPLRSDTVIVFQHDTVFVPEIVTVEKDPIVIRDTVYLPSELLKKPRGLFYREALGMLGGGYSTVNRDVSKGRLTVAAGNEWDFGVWDSWISGRQEIDSRVGLRFQADMAPWKSDTLSPRFLATSAEVMYIPAWDRSLFVFGGIRAYFQDNLFWDRFRASWDDNEMNAAYPETEPSGQELGHYEISAKVGLDKLSPYGTGKRFAAWARLAAIWPGPDDSGYLIKRDISGFQDMVHDEYWLWHLGTAFEGSGNVNFQASERLQFAASAGVHSNSDVSVGHEESWTLSRPQSIAEENSLALSLIHQAIAIRWVVLSSTDMRLRLEAGARNNILSTSFDKDDHKDFLESNFLPYVEAPQVDGSVQLDYNVVQFRAGVSAFMPKDLDTQIRPWGGLYFMFK